MGVAPEGALILPESLLITASITHTRLNVNNTWDAPDPTPFFIWHRPYVTLRFNYEGHFICHLTGLMGLIAPQAYCACA